MFRRSVRGSWRLLGGFGFLSERTQAASYSPAEPVHRVGEEIHILPELCDLPEQALGGSCRRETTSSGGRWSSTEAKPTSNEGLHKRENKIVTPEPVTFGILSLVRQKSTAKMARAVGRG